MRRNLYNRVEVLFPVMEARLRQRILRILATCMLDNSGTWELRSDGQYYRVESQSSTERINAQQIFMQHSAGLDLLP
jgi:polyphosphate kinase